MRRVVARTAIRITRRIAANDPGCQSGPPSCTYCATILPEPDQQVCCELASRKRKQEERGDQTWVRKSLIQPLMRKAGADICPMAAR